MHKTGFFGEEKLKKAASFFGEKGFNFEKTFGTVKIDFRQLYIMLGTTQEEFSKVFGIPIETLRMFEEKKRGFPDELHVLLVTAYNSKDVVLARQDIIIYRTKVEIFGEQSHT